MNSDGSLHTNSNRTAAGGIIRDHNGRFVTAFSANLGTCSIMRVELRGIAEGTKLAWDRGIRKLRIESDSKAAVEMLSSPSSSSNQHANIIEQFVDMSSQDWKISIHHIFREANCVADYLANLGHGMGLEIHLLDYPDVSLQYWLKFDLVGSCTSHLISNNM
ncbi:Putative ribonuclease H protein At1g65750 [Linum perenne]